MGKVIKEKMILRNEENNGMRKLKGVISYECR